MLGGGLALHYACMGNNIGAVEYFYKLYPNAINQASNRSWRISNSLCTYKNVSRRKDPVDKLGIVFDFFYF